MLAVQAGLFDPLPLKVVAAFRSALPAHLDKHAQKHSVPPTERTDLDDMARAPLMETLTNLAHVTCEEKTTQPRPSAHDRTVSRYQAPR